MLKILISCFLIINSLIGLLFWDGTEFGNYLINNHVTGYFVIANFLLSHIIVIIMGGGISVLSKILLWIVAIIAILITIGFLLYFIIFDYFKAKQDNLFGWVILFFLFILSFTLVISLLQPLLLRSLPKWNNVVDEFVDSYKKGIEDQYIEKSRKANPELAKVLDDTIDDLDRLDKILKDIMKSQK